MKVVGIQRAECFSPNSVENDKVILLMVLERFRGVMIPEMNLTIDCLQDADVILNMGRASKTLELLKSDSLGNALIINPAKGVEQCRRGNLHRLMRQFNIPSPPENGNNGYWVKRGDTSAQSKEDVRYCRDKQELEEVKEAFANRGIKDIVVQAHINGDLIKFYGIDGADFFKIYYPGDDGISKFGDELINGKPRHIYFECGVLKNTAEQLARVVSTPIYGGDAIVNDDGDYFIIDFNDWPSFSRCREEAASAIANYVMKYDGR